MSSYLIPGITELTARPSSWAGYTDLVRKDGSIYKRVVMSREAVDIVNAILDRLRQEAADREFLSNLVSDLKEDRGEIWLLSHSDSRSGKRVLGAFHSRQEAERAAQWRLTNCAEFRVGVMTVEEWHATEMQQFLVVKLPDEVCSMCSGTGTIQGKGGDDVMHCFKCGGGRR